MCGSLEVLINRKKDNFHNDGVNFLNFIVHFNFEVTELSI